MSPWLISRWLLICKSCVLHRLYNSSLMSNTALDWNDSYVIQWKFSVASVVFGVVYRIRNGKHCSKQCPLSSHALCVVYSDAQLSAVLWWRTCFLSLFRSKRFHPVSSLFWGSWLQRPQTIGVKHVDWTAVLWANWIFRGSKGFIL